MATLNKELHEKGYRDIRFRWLSSSININFGLFLMRPFEDSKGRRIVVVVGEILLFHEFSPRHNSVFVFGYPLFEALILPSNIQRKKTSGKCI